jgi:hypothetical protein
MPVVLNPTGNTLHKRSDSVDLAWFPFAGSSPHSPHVDRVTAWLIENTVRTNRQDRRKIAASFYIYIYGGTCERNETDAFLIMCNETNSKWLPLH